jgi:hypothetical protein
VRINAPAATRKARRTALAIARLLCRPGGRAMKFASFVEVVYFGRPGVFQSLTHKLDPDIEGLEVDGHFLEESLMRAILGKLVVMP